MYFGVSIYVDFYLCYFLSFSKNSDALLESESRHIARMQRCHHPLLSLLVQTGTPTLLWSHSWQCSEWTVYTRWLLMDTDTGECALSVELTVQHRSRTVL